MPDLTGAGLGSPPTLVAGDREWFPARVVAVASALADALGSGPPAGASPVAHLCELTPAAATAVYGVALGNRPIVIGHPGWSASERARFLENVRPSVAVTDAGAESPGEGWLEEAVDLQDVGSIAVWRAPGEPEPLPYPVGTEVMLWTSGSEGRPRVVCHSWETLSAGARGANARLAFGSGDTWLATLAWAHVGGLACLVRAGLAGARLAFGPPRFEPPGVLASLTAAGATHVSLVPVMLRGLLDASRHAPALLRVALLGGAAAPPALVARAIESGWPVALTYGLTEAGSQVLTATPADVRARPDSVGVPIEGMEARLREDGEIEVRGAALAIGSPGSAPPTRGSWLRTGDLGEVDGSGRWRIVGRKAARIVTGGVNVDPAEIEHVLAAHPEVRDVCVLGAPDPAWGEIVTAVVEPEPETPDDLIGRLDAWSRSCLSGPRIPRRWLVLPELPRTRTGKVDRLRLLERIAIPRS